MPNKNNIIIKSGLTISMLFSTVFLANATNFLPPPNCADGRAINHLKVESSKYFAIGIPQRVKGDYPYSPLSSDSKTVAFYNSHINFVGSDNTDSYDNAYLEIEFPVGAEGNQYIWAVDETNPLNQVYCSKTSVIVHKLPVIQSMSLSGGRALNVSVNAWISNLSKWVVDGNDSPMINYTFFNTDYNEVESISTTDTSLTYYPEYSGFYKITATISDGTFSTGVIVGYADFSGGIVPNRPIN